MLNRDIRPEINLFWPLDLSHKSGFLYGWIIENCWIVCCVGPLRNLEFQLSVIGSLNYNEKRSSKDWIDLITVGSCPQIKNNFTGSDLQFILYHRPRSYLQYLSIDELSLNLLSKAETFTKNDILKDNVSAHIKYPQEYKCVNMEKILDLVRI